MGEKGKSTINPNSKRKRKKEKREKEKNNITSKIKKRKVEERFTSPVQFFDRSPPSCLYTPSAVP